MLLKLKFQYFGHLMRRVDSLEKTLMLGKIEGKGLHLAMTGEPRGFSRVAAGFSSYDGEFRMPLLLAQGSPIFHHF